jgi:hypothetical protein
MGEVIINRKPWWNWKRTRLLDKIDDLQAELEWHEADAAKKDALIIELGEALEKARWLAELERDEDD